VKRVGIDPNTFKRDANGQAVPPAAFPANLSHGKSGEGRLFYVGDAAGTVPIITGSGVNKGIFQVVDDVGVIHKVLEDPNAHDHASSILAAHHAHEDQAQESLVEGFVKVIGPRLRPPSGALTVETHAAPVRPDEPTHAPRPSLTPPPRSAQALPSNLAAKVIAVHPLLPAPPVHAELAAPPPQAAVSIHH
jgi:hypothetical protein